MAYVHLPAEHSDSDLALAGAVADRLASAELWVAWSHTAGAARPTIPAEVSRPARPRRRGLASLLVSLRRRRVV